MTWRLKLQSLSAYLISTAVSGSKAMTSEQLCEPLRKEAHEILAQVIKAGIKEVAKTDTMAAFIDGEARAKEGMLNAAIGRMRKELDAHAAEVTENADTAAAEPKPKKAKKAAAKDKAA